MEFGKHIGKGMWGLAGRALPSVYGVGIIIFVIRSFPPVEFGVYTLLQTIFLLAVSTGQSFALQPLVKFAAQSEDVSGPVTASAALYAAFIAPVAVALAALAGPLGGLFNSHDAGALMHYVALMLIVSFPRNVASYVLQARLELRRLFVLDALYSLGSLVLIALLVPTGRLDTAAGLMQVNLLTLLLSSLYGIALLAGRYSVKMVPSAKWIRQAWDYGRYSLGASVSYTLFSQSDNLLISAIAGPVELAVYNAAKVFTRAFDMALQAMTLVLLPSIARIDAEGRRDELAKVAEKSFFVFTAGLLGLIAVVVTAGAFLIDLLYGERYSASSEVLYFLAVSGIFIPAISIGSSFFYGLGKMKEVFRITLLGSLAGILLIAGGTALSGIRGSAVAVTVSYGVIAALWLSALGGVIPLSLRGVLSRRTDAVNFVRRLVRDRRSQDRPGGPSVQ